jgi:hypothetical protein
MRHMQVIVPITVLAVYHAFAYCAKTFPNNTLWQNYGVRAHSFLAAHQVPHTLLHLHLSIVMQDRRCMSGCMMIMCSHSHTTLLVVWLDSA